MQIQSKKTSASDIFLLSLSPSSEAQAERACPHQDPHLGDEARSAGKGAAQRGPGTPSPGDSQNPEVSALPQARVAEKSEQTGEVPGAGQADAGARLHEGTGLTCSHCAVTLTTAACQSPRPARGLAAPGGPGGSAGGWRWGQTHFMSPGRGTGSRGGRKTQGVSGPRQPGGCSGAVGTGCAGGPRMWRV